MNTDITISLEKIENGKARCGYCTDSIMGEGSWTCLDCGAIQHDDCHRETRRCLSLGCRQAEASILEEEVSFPPRETYGFLSILSKFIASSLRVVVGFSLGLVISIIALFFIANALYQIFTDPDSGVFLNGALTIVISMMLGGVISTSFFLGAKRSFNRARYLRAMLRRTTSSADTDRVNTLPEPGTGNDKV